MFSGSRSSIPYLKMVCVCPPQTSINFRGWCVRSAIFLAKVFARSLCLYSSMNFMFFVRRTLVCRLPLSRNHQNTGLLNSVGCICTSRQTKVYRTSTLCSVETCAPCPTLCDRALRAFPGFDECLQSAPLGRNQAILRLPALPFHLHYFRQNQWSSSSSDAQ